MRQGQTNWMQEKRRWEGAGRRMQWELLVGAGRRTQWELLKGCALLVMDCFVGFSQAVWPMEWCADPLASSGMFAAGASVSALWRGRCSMCAPGCPLQLAIREVGKQGMVGQGVVAESVLEQSHLAALCGGRGRRWQQLLRE
jgi:hypothetical protein